MWTTPTATEAKAGYKRFSQGGTPLSLQAHQYHPSGQKSCENVRTSRRRLNPAFVSWMMGLPSWWTLITGEELMKVCLNCSLPIESKDWKKVKYCSRKCHGEAKKLLKPSKRASRKRAQRAVTLISCELCGSTDSLQRHHPDIANQPDMVRVLCSQCHRVEDQAIGSQPKRKVKQCLICQQEFLPIKRTTKVCGAECLAELGRRNALKRWQ